VLGLHEWSEEYSIWIPSPSAGSGSSGSSAVFSGVFVAEEVDVVGDKESGDTATFDVPALLEAFLNMSLRSVSFVDDDFSGKKQNFQFWDYAPQALDCQDFRIIRCQISGILLYYQKQRLSTVDAEAYCWMLF
jgi:hypothetical protein